MGKYDPLEEYLRNCRQQNQQFVVLTFKCIGKIIQSTLPNSAHRREWWGNENTNTTRHPNCRAWRNVGYIVDHIDLANQKVTFRIDII